MHFKEKQIITCSANITFEAAHRIFGHKGRCECLHGHRYVCNFTFTSAKLNSLGMVIDFAEIRNILGQWIKDNLDHNVLLYKDDAKLIKAIEQSTGQKIYVLKVNPTVENIASHFLEDICPKLFHKHNVRCISVDIEESATNKGSATIFSSKVCEAR